MIKFRFRNESYIFQNTLCLVDFLILYLRSNPDMAITKLCFPISKAKKERYHAFRIEDGDIVAIRFKMRWKKDEKTTEVVTRGREQIAALIEKEDLVHEKLFFC